MTNEGAPWTFAQVFQLMMGREPTPEDLLNQEELEEDRARHLMILNGLQMMISDSDDIWEELDEG